MAIIEYPAEIQKTQTLQCIVCHKKAKVGEMTIGVVSMSEVQCFACDEHLGRGESGRFVRAWIDFLVLHHGVTNNLD
jgi:hypothetical protein